MDKQQPPPAYGAPQQPGYAPTGYGGQPGGPPAVYNQPQPGYGGQPQPGYGGQPQPGGFAQPGMPMGAAPQQQQWMAPPPQVPGCPPGLEYLCQVDQLLVKQQIELLEAFTGWETNNKYKILNTVGQQVYFAAEDSDMCARQCCGPNRGFVIHITDNNNQEVIRITRDFKCCAGGCPWCACLDCMAHEVVIESPVGQVVGYVKQLQSCLEPNFSIENADHQEILSIKGPVCICTGPCCTADQEFIVHSQSGEAEVGKISKQWSGLARELFTDADNFGISFPMDLDVKMKAVMVGATFLIDFMFFEKQQNNNNRY